MSEANTQQQNKPQEKAVFIADDSLPVGKIANAAIVAGTAIGKNRPDIVGRDLVDVNGTTHRGITTVALPVLKASRELLGEIREKARAFEPELLVVDVHSATASTHSYEEYAEVLSKSATADPHYFGLALIGPKKAVNKFAGALPLLR